MTNDRVHQIFDTRGRTVYQGYGYTDREYRTPNEYGFVFVSNELSAVGQERLRADEEDGPGRRQGRPCLASRTG